MYVLRVCDVGKFDGLCAVAGGAVPQLCALNDIGACRKAPINVNSHNLRHSRQGCDRRRCPNNASQRRRLGLRPQARRVDGVERTDAGNVDTGVDAGEFNACSLSTARTDPVAIVPAPFRLIGHRASRGRPLDHACRRADALVNDAVATNSDTSRCRLHHGRNHRYGARLQTCAVINSAEFSRLMLYACQLKGQASVLCHTHHIKELSLQVFSVNRPWSSR